MSPGNARTPPRIALTRVALTAGAWLLAACGGGGSSSPPPSPPPPVNTLPPTSQSSTFSANCNGAPQSGSLYVNAEVEPYVVVNPSNPANVVGAWQQDRWSNGGAQGLMTGASFDGGHTWTLARTPFSRCTGGNATTGGDFERASDPWLAVSPDGTLYAMGLTFDVGLLAPNSSNAMLVARSIDGGLTWSAPTTLILDGPNFGNDKGSITADPADAHYVYAVWDRISAAQDGPAYFARTVDGGATWEPARSIFDPGASSQTLGNIIAVLPGGALIDLFTQIDVAASGAASASLRVIRSGDHGDTWSAPVTIADLLAIGARDPETGTAIRDGSDLAAIATDAAGTLYVVWQDARFSGGARDGIALSRSIDGGATWSAATQVNAVPGTQAFTPAVNVRSDGVIGVSYYDFRNNTTSAATLPTDLWLATSTDAVTFTERHVVGSFDMEVAPNAGGLFLGDYQGLASDGNSFLPFFAMTNNTIANRTDIFIVLRSVTASAASRSINTAPRPPAAGFVVTPEWRLRAHDAIVRAMERRIPHWHQLMGANGVAGEPASP